VEAVHECRRAADREIRAGEGPRLLHAITYRFKGHVSVDPGTYRDPAKSGRCAEGRPALVARERFASLGGIASELDAIDREAKAEIDAAVALASAAPWPDPAAAFTDIQTTGAGQWR
jgi:TPP-dependent pyruvate/acetoin dehydrogenase alpha subunit